jgi:hypothetical protein
LFAYLVAINQWGCASGPCRNGATCQPSYHHYYFCYCTSEYTGEQCESKGKLSLSLSLSLFFTHVITNEDGTVWIM